MRLSLLAATLGCLCGCAAARPATEARGAAFTNPDPRTAPVLGVRNAHGMVFDATRRQVVLFGGADASSVRQDTWGWDAGARRWILVTATGPDARTFPAMAFDEARGETVLFGGNRVLFGEENSKADTWLGDTWVLRGHAWVRLQVRGPSPRAEAAMTYDRARRRIVLFGGSAGTAGARVRYGDTWEWDGERWQLAATEGPTARSGAALAFDASRNTVVMSGGPPAFVEPDTWEWDGRVWRRLPGASPPGRLNPVMVYHAGISALLRFGGWTGRVRASDTWIHAQVGWRELGGRAPSARNHSAMAYDAHRAKAVLFGGHDGEDVFGDTWEFDGAAWRQVGRATPQKRIGNRH